MVMGYFCIIANITAHLHATRKCGLQPEADAFCHLLHEALNITPFPITRQHRGDGYCSVSTFIFRVIANILLLMKIRKYMN